MASLFRAELCDSEFLDLNITWYTDSPQFSPCFRDTLLVWLPASVFLLTLASEHSNIRKAQLKGAKTIPWNTYNKIRLLLTFVLLFMKLSEAFNYIYIILSRQSLVNHLIQVDNNGVHRDLVSAAEQTFVPVSQRSSAGVILGSSNSSFINEGKILVISALLVPIIQSFCYSLLALIYVVQRKVGVHTSGPVWFYLFISVLCTMIDYYAVMFSLRDALFDSIELYVDCAHGPLLLMLFIIECRGDTPVIEPDTDDCDPDDADRPIVPEVYASYCSQLSFWWYNKFLLFGYRSKLGLADLWRMVPSDRSRRLLPVFYRAWHKVAPAKGGRAKRMAPEYHTSSGGLQPANSIMWVLFQLFRGQLLFAASLKLIQDILQYVTPLILKIILAFMKSKNSPEWQGILYALLLLLVPTLQSFFLSNYFYRMQLIGLRVRAMIMGAVYRKSLALSGSSRLQSTSGEIVNLMSIDTQRFQDLIMYLNLFWSAPLQILLAVYMLYRELGWSIFAGVACMICIMPINAFLASRIKLAQIKVMKTKDERIKHANEIFGGIKVIKLYAWENSFIANLFSYRKRELSLLRKILTLDALQSFFWQCIPFVVACVTFSVYLNVDPTNVLDAEKAFVSISLFNLLRFPLTMLPSLITSMVLTLVSARRLDRFLNSNELVKYVTRNEELEAISIESGTLAWTSDETESATGDSSANKSTRLILRDIDFHVMPRSFVAVVGQVASGKSSLLSAILGEMHRVAGRFNICRSLKLAYVPQQAWIQNMTVKDNILFGSQCDEERYQRVLEVCSLLTDLETLPGGDQAEIGEKGINLSGGQKQRVSLARACYSESDVFLLDDPLSALDSHVAKHVFDEVLSSTTGILKNKTRVLATNSLFVLPYVDHIVVLDNGKVVQSGTYQQLMKEEKGHLADFMRQYSVNQKDQEIGVDNQQAPIDSTATMVSESPAPGRYSDSRSLARIKSIDVGRLVDIEKVETGSVSYQVYMGYLKNVSPVWMVAAILALIASAAFNVATNLWLSIWATDAEDSDKYKDTDLRNVRMLVYSIFGGLQCLSTLTGALMLCQGAIRAARRLHSYLLDSVMHSPMTFFDTTPTGRIVNRFAKDIDVVDSTLPGTFRGWLHCMLQVLSSLFVVCYAFPSFPILLVPLIVFYLLIQTVFIVTTRQLKRLESSTRSPIYSNFNETLSGLSTIRAYECVDRFVRYSDKVVDRNQSCAYPNVIANRWLSVRLEFFGNLITCSAAMFSVFNKGSVGAGIAGLTISYSLSITQALSWFVRMTSDLETHIVSVERILEYMQNKQEDKWIKEDKRPPVNWPQSGAIKINQYSARYRDNTDLVLRNISIDVKPSEKIGIVGRTGSGKSSLSLALFRILEPAAGSIVIDDLDLTKFGLHDIRSKFTIIPQDPILFSGTLRFNLDPLKIYPDIEIWRSLELAHLKPYISSLGQGLDYQVNEFGENFSVGQRQLICLARAILRKSKILILDEATASVDVETDAIAQRTIREIFNDCTIITIAHRLHTILDSDRILVLDSGQVKELDKPENLIQDENSTFASLVRDAGVDTSNIMAVRLRQTTSNLS